MKTELITLLKTLGYPVYLQGSLDKDAAYPETFFTFWNSDSADQNHYDNDAHAYYWAFEVNVYSSDPTLVNTLLLSAKTLLKQNGWSVGGKGHDLVSDEPTHTGRGITALYRQEESLYGN